MAKKKPEPAETTHINFRITPEEREALIRLSQKKGWSYSMTFKRALAKIAKENGIQFPGSEGWEL